MHIPDGYLSPTTCGAFAVTMVPFWRAAAQRVRARLATRDAPRLALAAAFTFVVMMFNVPIPGGTSAHAVGAVLVACLLGPWAAVIAVSVALAIQALLFGDGGVLSFGANAFNMAVAMPLAGYGAYRLVAGRSPGARRSAVGAALGGYVGINVSALLTAVELGVQPVLFRDASGPRYAPFDLSHTVPAMMVAHLLVAGVVEGALTASVLGYLRRIELAGAHVVRAPRVAHRWRTAWVCIAGLVLLTPLGLLAGGGAFGEDKPADLDLGAYGLRAVPVGLARYNDFWRRSVLDGYGADAGHRVVAYVLSAVLGVAAIALVITVIDRGVARLRRHTDLTRAS